jgi:hypothetical protein
MAWWWIIAILGVVIVILSVVNATRIENIRTEISDLDTRNYTTTSPSESMLMRNGLGSHMPKRAYWIKAEATQPDVGADGFYTLNLMSGINNDTADLLKDVASGRVAYVYRPDQREMYSIKAIDGDGLKVQSKVAGSASSLIPPGLKQSRMMTVIGVPSFASSTDLA